MHGIDTVIKLLFIIPTITCNDRNKYDTYSNCIVFCDQYIQVFCEYFDNKCFFKPQQYFPEMSNGNLCKLRNFGRNELLSRYCTIMA